MPSTSNSFVISLTERGISLSIASSMTQGVNDLPLNPLSIFSQIIEEIPIRNNFRFIRFSFDSRKTKTLNIIYKDDLRMNKLKHAIQDEYEDDFAWCYGCGRLNDNGLHLRTGWDRDGNQTITTYQPRDEHKAIPGFVYGGLMASLVDCHGTGSAALFLH